MHLILVDFDDTLVDTAPRFQDARARLFQILTGEGFHPEEIHRIHHEEVDVRHLERMGYGPFRLSGSFRETYLELCARNDRRAAMDVADSCAALGDGVPGTPAALDGALEALRRLVDEVPTAVYTQSSDPAYQMECIRGSGVLDILPADRVVITPRKTAESFRETLHHFEARDPREVWMVGNSIRSDVNPALANGSRAIHVEQESPWVHDVVELMGPDVPRVASFREAVNLLLGGA